MRFPSKFHTAMKLALYAKRLVFTLLTAFCQLAVWKHKDEKADSSTPWKEASKFLPSDFCGGKGPMYAME